MRVNDFIMTRMEGASDSTVSSDHLDNALGKAVASS
jgi:hypothetical protein